LIKARLDRLGLALELLQQALLIDRRWSQAQGIHASLSLPHPEVSPALAQAAESPAPHSGCSHQLSQPLFSPFPFKNATGSIAKADAAAASSKGFAQLVGVAIGAELQADGGIGLKGARAQLIQRSTGTAGWQKQGPMDGLSKGAFARFVGPLQHRDATGQRQVQLAMQPHMLQGDLMQLHGQISWEANSCSSRKANTAKRDCSTSSCLRLFSLRELTTRANKGSPGRSNKGASSASLGSVRTR